MAPVAKTLKLNSGHDIPTVGLGVFKAATGRESYECVLSALKLGYRHIDTAQLYGNEADVGQAVADSGIPREDIFITTKVWRSNWGHAAARQSIEQSLHNLKTTYIDLLLLHCPGDAQTRPETWRALEEAAGRGIVRSIGVSNFGIPHLEKLAHTANVPPAVNQIELSPFLQRTEIVRYCQAKGIVVEAYSPLCKATKLGHPTIGAVASRLGVTPAQVLIRWSLHKGCVPLPKSVHAERQRTNLDVFGFELSAPDLTQLDALEEGLVTGWDPITADLV